MSDKTTLYFIGEGPEAQRLITKATDRSTRHRRACLALAQELGADESVLNAAGAMVQVAFAAEHESPPTRRPGLRFVEVYFGDAGDGSDDMHVYAPNEATQAGQEIARRMHELGAVNFSNLVCNHLNAVRAVPLRTDQSPTGLNLAMSSAGARDHRLYLVVPKSERDPFTAPAWLKAVTFTDYNAALAA